MSKLRPAGLQEVTIMIKLLKTIIRAFLYYSGIWLVFRFRNRHKVAILMYHSVIDHSSKEWTHVSATRFREQIKYIYRRFRPVRLGEAVSMMKEGRSLPEHAVVVTFDDGFKNNKTVAYPILKEYQIPATIFLTTSFTEKNGRYGELLWTDYIKALFENTKVKKIDLSDFGMGTFETSCSRDRELAGRIICHLLKRREFGDKSGIVDAIRQQLKAEPTLQSRLNHQGLTWDNILEMNSEGLVEFGAHTVNHEILTRLPDKMMQSEIADSGAAIENKLGSQVKAFAYPNGTREDFNDRIKQEAAKSYICALTTIEGLNSKGVDLYELKRINVGGDMSMIEFKMALSGVNELLGRLKTS